MRLLPHWTALRRLEGASVSMVKVHSDLAPMPCSCNCMDRSEGDAPSAPNSMQSQQCDAASKALLMSCADLETASPVHSSRMLSETWS